MQPALDSERPAMLLIVCGLPFAGKTKMSRARVRLLEGAVHIEIDQINSERGLGLNGEAIPMHEWSATYHLAYARATEALSTGRTVVFDATNYSKAQRDILRTQARRTGGNSAVVFVDMPVEECRSRWLENRETGERYDVRDEDFERVVGRFDPPQGEERVILFLKGMRVQDLVSGLRQAFGQ